MWEASFAVSDAGQTFTLEYEKPVEVLNLYFADDWAGRPGSWP